MYAENIYIFLYGVNNNYGDYMKKINVYSYKSDIVSDNDNYKTIFFDSLNDKESIKDSIKKELMYFFNIMNISKKDHIFIIGLGNDNHTADSIGPKTLKYIKVNSYLKNLGINISDTKVSALEPGVLGETGIITEKIISSVSNEIKPDLIILIDSFVSDNINDLNKTIIINNIGIKSGCGIKGINTTIDKNLLGIPIIAIGVITCIEVKFSTNNKNFIPYILSTKDIDEYVINISEIIGNSINEVISYL